jgi:hypothetical protein
MKPEIKAQWLAALRSGDYQQGRSLLHYEDRCEDQFCCLGVLCDLYAKDTGNTWERHGSVCTMHGLDGMLPPQVQVWAGLEYADPMGLAGRNDDGATFEELAAIIEENL